MKIMTIEKDEQMDGLVDEKAGQWKYRLLAS
jgi:hypothetical protein